MPFLSSLFGNGDSETSNENGNSFDLVNDLDAVLSIDASSESYNESVDDDGSSETTWDSSHFGTDLDVGSILGVISDNFSSSDSDSDSDSGGLFG
jgi:hypothetical protein